MKCNVNLQNTEGPSETHIGLHWPETNTPITKEIK